MEHSTPAIVILILVFLGPGMFFRRRAFKGARYYLRKIKGIDEISYSVACSVEEGRPICFSTGTTDVSPLLYACLGILKHIAKLSARVKIPLLIPVRDPEALALVDATVKSAYQEEGRLSSYDPSRMRYLSSEQLAYASGYQGMVHRENAGACFLFGSFAAESLILSEAGQQIGAKQIAGTVSNEQIPFFVASCDYTLLGEELYATSAYLSGDPVQVGSLRGQDFSKLFLLCLVLLGVAFSTFKASSETKEKGAIESVMSYSWQSLVANEEPSQ